MALTLSGPRTLAISTVSGAFAWFIVATDASARTTNQVKYQSMTREAIIADLASEEETDTAATLAGALIIVLGVVVAVDGLTNLYDGIWRKLNPSPGNTPPPAA